MKTTQDYTIGLDLGDKKHYYCVLNAEGKQEAEGPVSNTKEGLAQWCVQWPGATIILETGSHSPWLSRYLESLGHRVVEANARKTRAIWKSDRKSDAHDARMLARIGRTDLELLSPVKHRSEAKQRDLILLKTRDALVRARVNAANSVRFLLKSLGVSVPGGNMESFAKRCLEALEASELRLIEPLLEVVKVTTEEIKLLEQQIEEAFEKKYPETGRFQDVPGVGPITAYAFTLVLESPERFEDTRSVGPFLGFVPKRDQSGESDQQLPISKAGNAMLRRLLVNCAHYILGKFGPPSALREAGMRIAARGGANAKKRAVIAVARKLAVLLMALWKRPEARYEPMPQAA